eukprot:5120529-Pyramimonas_sp.AAC.1
MCAALRREPHFESHPPSIGEALANSENTCARVSGESHILEATCPPSAKLLPVSKLQAHKW